MQELTSPGKEETQVEDIAHEDHSGGGAAAPGGSHPIRLDHLHIHAAKIEQLARNKAMRQATPLPASVSTSVRVPHPGPS